MTFHQNEQDEECDGDEFGAFGDEFPEVSRYLHGIAESSAIPTSFAHVS